MLELEVAGETFEFSLHNTGCGGPCYAAACVKYQFSTLKLPKVYQHKLDRLIEKGEFAQNSLDDAVFESCQTDWWEWATDRVAELGLGKIYSAGRSGGWLILHDWPESRLEGLLGDPECHYCGLPYREHAAGNKCLYEPTWYKPIEDADIERLRTIHAFLQECEESVKTYVPVSMRDEYKYRIDEAWADHQQRRKEKANAKKVERRGDRVSARACSR